MSSSSPSSASAMVFGGLSFAAVSVLAYSIWAFKLVPGTAALYSTTALVYVGLGGLALSRLVQPNGGRKRFPFVFAAAFVLYAICWCAFWFGLRGKFHADLWGAAAGLAAMTLLIRASFPTHASFVRLFGVLFMTHTLGYTLGDELHVLVSGTSGRLLWGAAYGVGFGTGLGYVLFHCQRAAENFVTTPPTRASSGPTAARHA